ncbi:MAG TPA: tetratricopeptide repeat protein [Chthonomonadaceae bacterium]|nr:tetratricopeptide repeat protein [Chthonomonadaceae bacterium]
MTQQEQEIHHRWLGESDRLIAEGDRHFDTQAFLDAQPFYSEALALRQAALGEQHESVAVALNRLANVYYQQKDDRAAGELFERALAIREAVLSPDASDLRLSVNNLANAYRNQGRFAEAEPLYCRSLQMREQETGYADHPAIWRNLVRVLEGQGKSVEAAEYVERIRVFESARNAENQRE